MAHKGCASSRVRGEIEGGRGGRLGEPSLPTTGGHRPPLQKERQRSHAKGGQGRDGGQEVDVTNDRDRCAVGKYSARLSG
jgi:hypothetical protein